MNESEGNETSGTQRFQIGAWARNAVGTMVVAGILAMVGNQYSNGRDISALLSDVSSVKAKQGDIEEFHKWPRFTLKHFNDLVAPVNLSIDHLVGDVEKIEARLEIIRVGIQDLTYRHYELKTEFKGLPPIEWQNKVSVCEQNVAAMREKIGAMEARLKN